jgi:hypothetical protein
VPGSNRQALEIDLHWNHLGPQERKLRLAAFDLIELEVPAGWGHLENFWPPRAEVERRAGRRVIRWRQYTPDDSFLTLKLSFEHPVGEVAESNALDAEDLLRLDDGDVARTRLTLRGRVEASFDGLLSGVTGIGAFLPGGGTGHHPRTWTQTKVGVTFDASLRSIRYQEDRVMPDENNASVAPLGPNKSDVFPGVVPDHWTVVELTNAISGNEFYVKSAVEHKPYPDDRNPGVLNRVWDLAGRRYIGLFPIDFDINLRGAEFMTADGRSGRTEAQVTVKGAFVKGTLLGEPGGEDDADADLMRTTVEADQMSDELLRQIDDTWTNLHGLVIEVLADRADRGAGRRALASSAENTVAAEVVVQREPGGWAEEVVEAIEVPGPEAIPPITTAVNGGPDRAAELRRQRKAADEAVIMGRISEETHHGVITRIAAELNELGEPA